MSYIYNLNLRYINFLFLLLLLSTIISEILNLSIKWLLTPFYSLFIPGYAILMALKIKRVSLTELSILSFGISVALIMFLGAFASIIGMFINIEDAFTVLFLPIFYMFIIFALFMAFLRNYESTQFKIKLPRFNFINFTFLILAVIMPFISLIGTYMMNYYCNNWILIGLYIYIFVYLIFISFFNKKIFIRILPIILFLISISIVLVLALRSNHLIGSDAHAEFFIFMQNLDFGRWHSVLNSVLDSCLSISILPIFFQIALKSDPEFTFKLLYPCLFASTPIIIYLLSKKYLNPFLAFMGAVFFMTQWWFITAAAHIRTSVAILFFALIIFIIFGSDIQYKIKTILIVLFSFALIVSHYATAYITLFSLVLCYLTNKFIKILNIKYNLINYNYDKKIFTDNYNLNFIHILLFFILAYIWFDFVSPVVLYSGLNFIAFAIESLYDFLHFEGINYSMNLVTGKTLNNLPSYIHYSFWLTSIIFTVIGLIFSYIKMFKDRFFINVGYLSMGLSSSFILFLILLIPFFSVGYDLDRVYCQFMVVLSPFFILGCEKISKAMRVYRMRNYIALAVLIPLMASNSGVLYQVFGIDRSICISCKGNEYDTLYVYDADSSAANFIKKFMTDLNVASDRFGSAILVSQALISQGRDQFSFYAKELIELNGSFSGLFYFRVINIEKSKILDSNNIWRNVDIFYPIFNKAGQIYDSRSRIIIS